MASQVKENMPDDPDATPRSVSDVPAEALTAPTVSRAYQCQCGRPVFLRNSRCLACQTPLGYVIERLGVVPLAPVADSEDFTVFGDGQGPRFRRCENFTSATGCNWMVPATASGNPADAERDHGLLPGMCLACSTTRTIPDLSAPENPQRWNRLEQAKRRLISQLLALGLPVVTRVKDPAHGLAFDFLS